MNTVLFPVRRIHEQVTEVARPFGAFHRLADVIYIALVLRSVSHVHDKARMTIRARSADFRETLNTRREKSWHQTTLGEVVKEIAARHKLKMALGKDLTDKALDHLDQTNESDASFLMKLARQYGAIASVKDGNLLFIRQGQGRTASGKPLPVINDAEWTITTLTHTVSPDNGFTTSLELEVKIDDLEME